jgi:hypothetical protein
MNSVKIGTEKYEQRVNICNISGGQQKTMMARERRQTARAKFAKVIRSTRAAITVAMNSNTLEGSFRIHCHISRLNQRCAAEELG